MTAWQEIGERVFVRRHQSYDVNVGLVVGGKRCLVIDTRASLREGTEVAAAVREVTALPWLVVNTHAHFDHFLGNAAFAGADIWASRRCAELIAAFDPTTVSAEPAEVRVPTRTFTLSRTLQIGDRAVELSFAGRGHTDHDVVAIVEDITFAGDLVEEGAPPAFEDAYPLDWPATLEALIATAPGGPVVPGHGAVVDWAFVRDQRDLLARVAEAGRTGDWRDVGLPDEFAAIARSRCAHQLHAE